MDLGFGATAASPVTQRLGGKNAGATPTPRTTFIRSATLGSANAVDPTG